MAHLLDRRAERAPQVGWTGRRGGHEAIFSRSLAPLPRFTPSTHTPVETQSTPRVDAWCSPRRPVQSEWDRAVGGVDRSPIFDRSGGWRPLMTPPQAYDTCLLSDQSTPPTLDQHSHTGGRKQRGALRTPIIPLASLPRPDQTRPGAPCASWHRPRSVSDAGRRTHRRSHKRIALIDRPMLTTHTLPDTSSPGRPGRRHGELSGLRGHDQHPQVLQGEP